MSLCREAKEASKACREAERQEELGLQGGAGETH